MCGIAGVLDLKASTAGDELAAAAAAMARTLAHRGPDGEATWVDEQPAWPWVTAGWRSSTSARPRPSR